MGIELRRVDNMVGRKIAILLCNHTYRNVCDTQGILVDKVFEARHKTALMEKFLQTQLAFDSVKTLVDVDLEAVH